MGIKNKIGEGYPKELNNEKYIISIDERDFSKSKILPYKQ
jgi:hypothetical protein